MKIHGFQAKWSILWPHSWHSLFKWSHIVHKCAYWNGKQCCLRKFSFSLDEKFIFHFFLSAQNEHFCESPIKYFFKWSHIVHNGISWNSKQCCLGKFSFSLHGKFIFHFASARNVVFFLKDLPYIYCKIGPNQFYKILGHI